MSREEPDLSALDPERDRDRWEDLVESIMLAAKPELERRSIVANPLLLLLDWFRPTVTAAALVGAFAASAALFLGEAQPAQVAGSRIITEAIGLPSAMATWFDTGSAAALDELVLAIEEAP